MDQINTRASAQKTQVTLDDVNTLARNLSRQIVQDKDREIAVIQKQMENERQQIENERQQAAKSANSAKKLIIGLAISLAVIIIAIIVREITVLGNVSDAKTAETTTNSEEAATATETPAATAEPVAVETAAAVVPTETATKIEETTEKKEENSEEEEEDDGEDVDEDVSKNDEQVKDEAEAEEISNLERLWKMFELAKLIYSKYYNFFTEANESYQKSINIVQLRIEKLRAKLTQLGEDAENESERSTIKDLNNLKQYQQTNKILQTRKKHIKHTVSTEKTNVEMTAKE